MELIHYDSETGIFKWKVFRGNTAKAGSVIGWNHKDGYLRMEFGGRSYLLHRVAWFYVHGKWPESMIDHIDGNPKNNAISNLREADENQNCWNRRNRRDNTTGIKGVSIKHGKWVARVTVNGDRLYLGAYDTPEDARDAIQKLRSQAHGEFANHG
jgi:hypothetical protein